MSLAANKLNIFSQYRLTVFGDEWWFLGVLSCGAKKKQRSVAHFGWESGLFAAISRKMGSERCLLSIHIFALTSDSPHDLFWQNQVPFCCNSGVDRAPHSVNHVVRVGACFGGGGCWCVSDGKSEMVWWSDGMSRNANASYFTPQ